MICPWGVMLLLAVLLLAVFWLGQLMHLMSQSDHFFPGRYDKLIWAALFVLVVPLTPFLYFFWKIAQEEKRLNPTKGL